MFEDGLIDHVVINTKERLLHQWIKEMRRTFQGLGTMCPVEEKRVLDASRKDMTLFRHIQSIGRTPPPDNLLASGFVNECTMSDFDLSRTLIVADEVHNIGSDQNQDAMTEADEEVDEV